MRTNQNQRLVEVVLVADVVVVVVEVAEEVVVVVVAVEDFRAEAVVVVEVAEVVVEVVVVDFHAEEVVVAFLEVAAVVEAFRAAVAEVALAEVLVDEEEVKNARILSNITEWKFCSASTSF